MNYDYLIENAIKNNEIIQLLCGKGKYEIEVSKFTSDVFPTDINAVLVNCFYKQVDNRSFMQYPDGQKIIYHRDEIGRVKAITCGTYEKTYRYDTTGRLCSTRMGNGIVSHYAYDTKGNLSDLTHLRKETCLEHIQYQYDETGTIISQTRKSQDTAYDYVREFTLRCLFA